jgi:hypothetical protein
MKYPKGSCRQGSGAVPGINREMWHDSGSFIIQVNKLNNMLYTETKYPDKMNHLPDEVRRKAIKITNNMMADGDIRFHKDLIIAIAIAEAQKWARQKEDLNMN